MSKPNKEGGGVATFEDIEVRKADPKTFVNDKGEPVDGAADRAFEDIQDTLERAVEAGKTVEEAQGEIRKDLDSIKDGVAAITQKSGKGHELSRKARQVIEDAPQRIYGERNKLPFLERVCMIPESEARDVPEVDHVRKLNNRMLYVRRWAQLRGEDPTKTETYRKLNEAAGNLERGYGADSASGDVLLPTLTSTELDEMLEQKPGIMGLFDQVPMTSKKYTTYRRVSRGKAFAAPDNAADISEAVQRANDTFASLEFDAKTAVGAAFIDTEWMEDQVIVEVPTLMASQAESIRQGVSDAIWNGHAVSSHTDHFEYVDGSSSDYAVTGRLDMRTQIDGLRRLALNSGSSATATNVSGGTLYWEDIVDSMGNQGIFGQYPPDEVFWFGPMNVWKHLVKLEVSSSDSTKVHAGWDFYGPNPFIRTGTLGERGGEGVNASFMNSPFITSEHLCGELNTSGVYDGSTTDNTQLGRCVPKEFSFATRQGIRQVFSSEQGLVMLKDYIQSTFRYDFLAMRGALGASYAPVHIWRNINA